MGAYLVVIFSQNLGYGKLAKKDPKFNYEYEICLTNITIYRILLIIILFIQINLFSLM